ncbi:MAG: PKD domain-containing protein [Bacteroidota bacterium]
MRKLFGFVTILLLSASASYAQGPQAAFAASDTFGCAPIAISFTDLSTGTPVAWDWDFGDGNSSTLQNPTHTYTANGWYWVNLQVTDAGGNNDSTWLWLNLNGPEIFGIQAGNQLICGPGPVDFFAWVDSFQTNITYEWTATGPITLSSTLEFPTFDFTAPGVYDVEVITTGGNGCTDTFSTTVDVPVGMDGVGSSTPENCGQSDGTASIAVTGGTSPFAYIWSNGATTPTITGLTAGFYTVATTDANGCTIVDTVEVEATGLDLVVSSSNPSCAGDSNGYVTVDVTNGTAPYTYTWNGVAGGDSLGGLGEGGYVLVVVDAAGCAEALTIVLENDVLDLAFVTTDADCNDTGGGVSVAVSGGSAPYTYLWSTGDTGTDLVNVPVGGYSVTVSDNAGCSDHDIVYVEYADSCLITLSGQMYFDVDQNCVYDSTDFAVPGMVVLSNGTSVLANWLGQYSVDVPPGTYAVTYNPNLYPLYDIVCPASGTYLLNSLTADSANLDFAFYSDSIEHDLRVYIWKSNMRPGFNHNYWINAYNYGPIPTNAVVSMIHDTVASFVSSNPPATTYDPNTREVRWALPSVGPGQVEFINATGSIPQTVLTGIMTHTYARIDPTAGDYDVSNNVDSVSRITTLAYDPNDKQVEPAGTGPEGFITQDQQEMHYQIRYQNTGTDTAFTVIIRDTIESDLDISTFKPATNSHTYDLTIEEENILVFTYNNILLPDSATDEEGSQGHVSFLMQHNGTLPYGTEIRNKAAIYFDFNPPIITNEVLNTIERPTAVDNRLNAHIQMFPNPTQGAFVVAHHRLKVQSISIVDLTGRTLLNQAAGAAGTTEFDLSAWPAGTYLVRVYSEEGIATQKVTLTK